MFYISREEKMFEFDKDEIVKNPKAKRTTLWDHFGIALAEYFGTTTLLCLSCMGGALGIQGVLSSMHTSFTAGLAVTVAIQVGTVIKYQATSVINNA